MDISKLNLLKDKTNNLNFEIYNENNIGHNRLIKDIAEDKEVNEYVSDISRNVVNVPDKTKDNNDIKHIGLIVQDKNINEYIGVVVINENYDYISLDIAVRKEYRSNKNHYGTKIINLVTNDIFDSYDYSMVVLEIKKANKASVKMAENCGYFIDATMFERFAYEGYECIPYTKNRENKKSMA